MVSDAATTRLIAAKPYFKACSPSYPMLIANPQAQAAFRSFELGKKIYRDIKALDEGASSAAIVGTAIGTVAVRKLMRKPKAAVTKFHVHIGGIKHDFSRKNGIGGRSWITTPGRYEMVIVYHDANRAGPHIDVHIGRMSLVYKVKPDTYAQLRYNRSGELTEASKKLLVDHVRSEIQNGSRVPQNIDHSVSNARSTWVHGDREAKSYGSGYTRQIIHTSDVDIYKAYRDGPIEMYAPQLNPHRSLYMYKLYPGDSKRAPILIFGAKTSHPPKLNDRLHLKLMHPEDLERVRALADMRTSTAKYDGSSCYFVIGPKGTTVWSPRISKITGEQIEYTNKMDGLVSVTSPNTIVGMGEIVFRTKTTYGPITTYSDHYLPQAQASGLLNSNSLLPEGVQPEIRIYRIDSIGKVDYHETDFWENRKLQEDVATKHSMLKVVELMTPEQAKARGFEGVVAVPAGGSVNDGMKVKWWTDPHDWRIDKVDLQAGEKGGIAGVVRCTSLDSGKTFNLGPGQIGSRELNETMMADPQRFEGTVLKVQSRHGHEGRASKVIAFHDDKGLASW